MIVPIESSATSETPEWGMIELNGELVMPETANTCDELELGSLKWSTEDTPIMIVGGHELKGNVVKLKKPFAILKKRKRDDDVDYRVVGVVTKKLLFDQYPKSIMR